MYLHNEKCPTSNRFIKPQLEFLKYVTTPWKRSGENEGEWTQMTQLLAVCKASLVFIILTYSRFKRENIWQLSSLSRVSVSISVSLVTHQWGCCHMGKMDNSHPARSVRTRRWGDSTNALTILNMLALSGHLLMIEMQIYFNMVGKNKSYFNGRYWMEQKLGNGDFKSL